MGRIFILRKRSLFFLLLLAAFVFGSGTYIYDFFWNSQPVASEVKAEKEFSIITTEYKAKMDDGRILEVYRWNPGMIVVEKGDKVTLNILGVQGNMHPFEIKGLGVKGEVKKGRETKVTFIADREGTFPIICQTHSGRESNGPMVGYIVVD